jgi:hypothetical protein
MDFLTFPFSHPHFLQFISLEASLVFVFLFPSFSFRSVHRFFNETVSFPSMFPSRLILSLDAIGDKVIQELALTRLSAPFPVFALPLS